MQVNIDGKIRPMSHSGPLIRMFRHQFPANSIVTDDEDDTSYESIPNNDSGTCCYRRRGRGGIKTSTKPFKNGHVRTKSEGSALFKQDKKYFSEDKYGLTNIPDLTNVEMLSHLGHSADQNCRRRVQSISRDRDLSPSEVVRQYITKEKEDMDIITNVAEQSIIAWWKKTTLMSPQRCQKSCERCLFT